MPVLIPVHRIARHCNPFGLSPWGVPLTRADVRHALRQRRLVATHGGDDHPGRIAYFVENPARDAIEIDVGVPVLGYLPDWLVQDGNHRLAAAIFSGRMEILADVQGQLSRAKRIFGVDCANY